MEPYAMAKMVKPNAEKFNKCTKHSINDSFYILNY